MLPRLGADGRACWTCDVRRLIELTISILDRNQNQNHSNPPSLCRSWLTPHSYHDNREDYCRDSADCMTCASYAKGVGNVETLVNSNDRCRGHQADLLETGMENLSQGDHEESRRSKE
jgi:hypothetical protein